MRADCLDGWMGRAGGRAATDCVDRDWFLYSLRIEMTTTTTIMSTTMTGRLVRAGSVWAGDRPRASRRSVVVRAGRRDAKSGGKGDGKNKKGGKNAGNAGKKGAKGLKPPMEGRTTVTIGSVSVEVPTTLPTSLDEVPRPALYAGGALTLLLLKKILFGRKRGGRGSLGDLEERGMLDENREVDEEKFYKGMMKSVRTMDMPELTEEQILAARERRRQSAAGDDNFKKSLDSVDIPANHPWATKEQVSAEDEAAAEQRVLEANRPRRRRVPPSA